MANEIVESSNSLLVLSQTAVEDMRDQRLMLAKFVKSQLVEADFSKQGEGDYGVIPGTKKNCLFKQGAEKLMRLFSLGVRFKVIDKEVDRHANFALYTYEAEVYLVRTGQAIASCMATANSQEVKYKERTEWRKNANGVRESFKVETPIYDVINTLQKMAQKRALVGAVILATGASEYFTQDVLDADEVLDAVARDVTEPVQAKTAPVAATAATGPAPQCCGKEMMISKYVDRELGHAPWYCMTCKTKLPVESAS